ncbi:chemotaxis protein [Capilliphycus salinus ALCB114379]|uniref:chemotaxis protein n=1 Tax=Capilliphycus salinus TaxID=2768948 RepID=UPI0039A695BC
MSSSSQITFDSTLESLAYHTFQINSTTPGLVVAQEFHQNPELPGVIVVDNERVIGMISRANFREQMNYLNRKNLYLSQPIQLLLDVIRVPPLILSKDCKILVAANEALSRPNQLVYEPLVIEFEPGQYRLLDIHHLLLAQNQLLNFSYQKIKQQKLKLKQSDKKFEAEKSKVIKYEAFLQQKTSLIHQQYNQDLSQQQAKLTEYTQPIIQLNQHFVRVSERILVETRKAFHSIFLNTNLTYRNTEHLFEISQAMARDLEAVNSTSQLLGEIIQKVRHLAVQAAIFTYQLDSSQPEGLSKIGLEINRLVSETSKVSDQMNSIARQLKFNLQELRESALEDARISCSTLSYIEQAENVIIQLEHLVNSSLIHQKNIQHYSSDATYIIQSIQRALKCTEDRKN